MTQHMGMMEFSDEEDQEGDAIIGYLQLLPPFSQKLGWLTTALKDGETSVGRTDEQDITIADPSVSGAHAAIDVVDLAEAGGKRFTLKDVHSTNGTYVISAETGVRTRLAPKKAMMLPAQGCRIHFGAVVCKVAMGPAPSASAIAEEEEAQAAGVFEADTQLPGEFSDDVEVLGAASDAKKDGTEPLPPVGEEEEKEEEDKSNEAATEATIGLEAVPDAVPAALAAVSGGLGGGGNIEDVDADTEGPAEHQEKMANAASERRSTEGIHEAHQHEQDGDGNVDETPQVAEVDAPPTDAGGSWAEDIREAGGVRFEEGAGDGDSARRIGSDEDEGGAFEPPTQCMPLECDVSSDDDDDESEKMDRADDGFDQGAPGDADQPEARRAADVSSADVPPDADTTLLDAEAEHADNNREDAEDAAAKSLIKTLQDEGGDEGGAEPEDPNKTLQDEDNADPDNPDRTLQDDGDETADERDIAGLFDTDEEGDVAKAAAGAQDPERGTGGGATPPCISRTPLTPSTVGEYHTRSGPMTSPGCFSDVSTQRQGSPGGGSSLGVLPATSSSAGEGGVRGLQPDLALQSAETTAGTGGGEQGDATATASSSGGGGAGEGDDRGGNLGEDSKEDRKESDEDDIEDGDSDSSGALIPACDDLDGFEDDLVDTPQELGSGPQPAAGVTHTAVAGGGSASASIDHNMGTGAAAEAADGSGSETDATEVDTDDGPAETAPTTSTDQQQHTGEGDANAPVAGVGADKSSESGSSPGTSNNEAGGVSPGEERTPGGTVLRRTTTEDAMQAIAREQQRADAARAAALAARDGAHAIAFESEEEEEEQEEGEEADTQVVAVMAEVETSDGDNNEEDNAEGKDDDEEGETEILEESETPGVGGGGDAGTDSAPTESVAEEPLVERVADACAASGGADPSSDDVNAAGKVETPEEGDRGSTVVVAREDREKSGNVARGAEALAKEAPPAAGAVESVESDVGKDEDIGRDAEGQDRPAQADGGEHNEEKDEEEKAEGKEQKVDKSKKGGGLVTPPASPRTSGRRRVKPKHFDEVGGESSVGGVEAPASAEKRKDTGKGTATGWQQSQVDDVKKEASSEEGSAKEKTTAEAGSPRATRGRGRAARGVAEQEEPKEPDASPAASTGRRGRGGRTAAATRAARDSQDGTQAEERDPPARGSKRRRLDIYAAGAEDEESAEGAESSPPGVVSKRGRRSYAAAALAEKAAVKEASPVKRLATGGRRRTQKEPQQGKPAAETLSASAANVAATRGKGKGRKRRADADDEEEIAVEEEEEEEVDDTGKADGTRDTVGGKGRGRATVATRKGRDSRKRKAGGADTEEGASSQGTTKAAKPASVAGEVATPSRTGARRGVRTSAPTEGQHRSTASPATSPAKRGRGRSQAAADNESASLSSAAAASPSPTPAKAGGRGRGRASPSPAVPVSAAAAGRSASDGSAGKVKSAGVKVCFTNVKPTGKERACIKKLGISEVENVVDATHLVAGGSGVPLKRTPKLLAGIGQCRFVVDVEWLYQSAAKGTVLDGLQYVLCDSEAEKKWDFNMRLSLGRRPDDGLLSRLSVYVDPSVAGTKGMGCPPLKELKMVVQSAGGTWLQQIPKRGSPDPKSLLVISHPDALTSAGASGTKSRAAAASGRNGNAYLPEMLFLCILRQKMSWPRELVVGSEKGTASAGKRTPVKRRKL